MVAALVEATCGASVLPEAAGLAASAGSAEAATNSGRLRSRLAIELAHQPQAPGAARFGACLPDRLYISDGWFR
jgi:hypothetical protein